MSDEVVIKRKLMFDGDGTGEDKKILTFLKLLPKWILSDDTSENSEAIFNKLLAQLESIVTSRKKLALTRKSNAKQMEAFKILQTAYKGNIKAIKEDIEKQKILLKKAKVVKQNFIEYDLLLLLLNKEATRNNMREKISNLEREIETLEKEKEKWQHEFDSKVKQCFVFSTSANALKDCVKVEMDLSSTKSEL